MALRLIIEDDEGTTTVVPLGADAITIGRQQGNTIQLTEKNVSRRHARLFPEPDEDSWSIEDLGSYNGVKVNGSAVEARIELKEGDVVQIGDYHLTLTENADKTAVTPNPTAAANDTGAPEEPMLASSSTDLPRLSTEDLAALQSGPVPVQHMGDSGAVPAVAGPSGFEEERKSSTGLLIGAGAVVVGALVLAFAWMAGSGNDDAAAATVASAEKPKVAADAKTMAQADPNAGLKPGVIEPEPEPGVVPDPVVDAGEPEPEVELDPEPEPATPTASKPKQRKPRKAKPEGGAKKTPPPPKAPAVDTEALLKEAAKASFGNFSKCYDLAKKAYDASRSSEAAYRMGVCACKMGDAGKAKKAASKLRGSKKEKVAKLCEPKGITL
jgi:hypothetical protein